MISEGLTKHQISLMEHTVGIGRGGNRNFFGTSLKTEDSFAFEELVEMGLATAEIPPAWMGDEVIYRLTKKAREALNG